MLPWFHGGRCAGIFHSIRRLFLLVKRPGMATRTVRHLALGQVATHCEDVMACFHPNAERLHALIGDAVLDLPASVVTQLETLLVQPRATSFMHQMARMNYPLAADGTVWDEPGATIERSEALAQVSRSLHGLGTVLALLAAGLMQRRDPGAEQLGDNVLQGLLAAGRELVESATDALHEGR